MLEVEVKYRAADHKALRTRLKSLSATPLAARTEEDRYFNAPDRDFRQSDEAFRLRRIGARNVLTYKGPKRDAETKTRTEIEVPLNDGDDAAQKADRLLTALGYRFVALVRKQRELWRLTRDGFEVEVCLDRVEQVGEFVELEIQAEECDYEKAKAVVLAVAAELGLTEMERRSYLGLLLGTS